MKRHFGRTIVVWSPMLALLVVIVFTLGCARDTKEMKIGAILPLTGDAALYGEICKTAADLALEEINAKGGVKGSKLSIVYEDSQADPKLAVNATNKLITVDKVTAIMGAMGSSEVMAIAPILNEKRIVLVSPAATSHEITQAGDYIFRTIVSDVFDGTAMARSAYQDKGIRTVGVLHVTEAGPQGVAEAFVNEFRKLGGTVLTVEKSARGDKDFRTPITRINAQNPDAIYFALYPRETELFVRQVRELGTDRFLMTHQLIDDPEVLGKLGEAADGIVFTTPKLSPEIGGAGVKQFYDKYKQKYVKEPQQFAANSYDAVVLIAKAMEKYGFDSESIKKGLYEVKDYEGASGLLTVDENGDVQQKMSVMEIRDGKTIPYK